MPRLVSLLVILALAPSTSPLGGKPTERVTIYRDTWGVPHIYGESEEAAAYGHGWAQAEDRLEDVLRAYREAQGRASSVLGEAWLERDYVARVARHAEVARARWPELGPEWRGIVEQFVAGVRAWIAEHPEALPDWAELPEPQDVVALYRAFAWAWTWRQAMGELRANAPVDEGVGSNQWVVGPRRSAEGVALALIDPHLSWEGTTRFYEAHVHGGGLNSYGFSIVGTPILAVGHTDVLSLAATTGGPDTADVYEERLHPDDPQRYEYDGSWRRIEVQPIEIEVRTEQGVRIERRTVERTHHGPILSRQRGRAYAVRTAYDEEVGLGEQWLRMVRARNLGEFLDALSANQTLPQNLMYADVGGMTYYVRAGRVPVRLPGFAWDRPVPGWLSATEWQGIHALADLVQILNPAAGFMQNCNVSPGTMMPDSPLVASRYEPYLYNTSSERSNSRGRRATTLLAGASKLSIEDALRIAVDTEFEDARGWQRHLAAAWERHRAEHAPLEPAVALLLAWNRRMDVDSRAAPLFRSWVRAAAADVPPLPADLGGHAPSLSPEAELALLRALHTAAEGIRRAQGRIDVAWGDVHRAGRGGTTWPVAGCNADGIHTLRSVRGSQPDARGVSQVTGGQMCTTVVALRRGAVSSWSATPYGQSDRPDSAHYTDQGRKLFSGGLLKPTWFAKAELLQHVESQRTLRVPVPPRGR